MAVAFAQAGASDVFVTARKASNLRETEELIAALKTSAAVHSYALDVQSRAQVEQVVLQILQVRQAVGAQAWQACPCGAQAGLRGCRGSCAGSGPGWSGAGRVQTAGMCGQGSSALALVQQADHSTLHCRRAGHWLAVWPRGQHAPLTWGVAAGCRQAGLRGQQRRAAGAVAGLCGDRPGRLVVHL